MYVPCELDGKSKFLDESLILDEIPFSIFKYIFSKPIISAHFNTLSQLGVANFDTYIIDTLFTD